MPKTPATYAALLLGINIGPHKRVPMDELRKLCARLGWAKVRTLLASGNVLFETTRQNPAELALALETALQKKFGFEVGVIVRPVAELQRLVQADPFHGITVTEDTRLYATFYAEKPKGKLPLPFHSTDPGGGSFRILAADGGVAYSVVVLGQTGTSDAMKILGKMFGKKITTRNWNTVQKLAQ